MKLKTLLFLLFFSNISFAYEFMPFEINTRNVIEKKYGEGIVQTTNRKGSENYSGKKISQAVVRIHSRV